MTDVGSAVAGRPGPPITICIPAVKLVPLTVMAKIEALVGTELGESELGEGQLGCACVTTSVRVEGEQEPPGVVTTIE